MQAERRRGRAIPGLTVARGELFDKPGSSDRRVTAGRMRWGVRSSARVSEERKKPMTEFTTGDETAVPCGDPKGSGGRVGCHTRCPTTMPSMVAEERVDELGGRDA